MKGKHVFEDLQLVYFDCSLDSFISLRNVVVLVESYYGVVRFNPNRIDLKGNK